MSEKEAKEEGDVDVVEEKVQLPVQNTILIIKPHACGKKVTAEDDGGYNDDEDNDEDDDESDNGKGGSSQITVVEDIVRKLKADGWTIVRKRRVQINSFDAIDICSRLSKSPKLGEIIGALTAAPLVALECSRPGKAIEMMLELVGASEDPDAEREKMTAESTEKASWTYRATYGVNTIYNGVMCSGDIFSRDRERSILFPPNEDRSVTCCLIKPDGMLPVTATATEGVGTAERTRKPWEEIKATIRANGLVILGEREVKLTAEHLLQLYPGKTDDETFQEEVAPHLTSARSTVLAIEGRDAVTKWRMLMGPADPEAARLVAPKSLRAQFGKDPIRNAIEGSATNADADRDIRMWFPNGFEIERTLAMVKPLAAANHLEAIIAKIQSEGFTILDQQRVHLTRERAELFYAEHKRRAFFGELTKYMSSGPVYVLVLYKPGAIKHWRKLQGPTNTEKAKAEAPSSLRAQYGTDGTRNAVHGSDSREAVDREVNFFFPLLSRRTATLGAPAARKLLSTTPAGEGSASRTLHSVVIEGLTELCKIKPVGLDAVRWLGNWFSDHNPNRPQVQEPDDDDDAAGGTKMMDDLTLMLERAAVGDTKQAQAGPSAVMEAKWSADANSSEVVFVLGAPGSGKTTVCQRIAAEFGYAVLSTTTLLKHELDRGTPLGLEIKEAMSRGELVPLETVLRVLKMAMQRSPKNKFVIDGYPRQLSQAFAFEQLVCKCKMVIHINVTENTMRQRLQQRGSGMAEEMITKRLVVYRDFCRPVISLYKKLGKVVTIEGEEDVESVWAQTAAAFQKQIVFVVGGPETPVAGVCAAMAEKFGFVDLSVAALVKREIASGSRVGQHLDTILKAGRLVPHDITMQLLRQTFEDTINAKFIVQGFPRTLSEAIHFEEHIGSCTKILDLACPAAVQRRRFRQRHGGCPPLSEQTAFGKRLGVYEKDTGEVLDFYRRCGLVSTINANQPLPKVVGEVRSALLPNVFFVVGGPGSGTSELCARVARELNLTHLNIGALLRAEIARASENGQILDRTIRSGQIVPVEMTLKLLRACFESNLSANGTYIIDEWPRALDQAKAFEETIAGVTRVVYLRADGETLRRRATDMDNERFARRMALFNTQTVPVIDHYAHRGVVDTIDIDGNADEDALYAAFKSKFVQEMVLAVSPPGSEQAGKVWGRVATEFGFKRVSAAELVKVEHQRGTATGKLIRSMLESNKMVTTSLKMRLLRQVLGMAGARKFVVEQFPNDVTELATLQQMLGAPRFCVQLEQSKESYVKQAKNEEEKAALAKKFDEWRFQMLPLTQSLEAAGTLRRVTLSSANPFEEAKRHFLPKVTLLVGCAGTGRGEVATLMGREFGFARIHVTSLLRAEAESGSDAGIQIAKCLRMRRTVPTEVALPLVMQEVRRVGRSNVLLDGFPRLVSWSFPLVHDQAFALDEVAHVQRVIVLKCSKDEKLRRCADAEAVEVSEGTFTREKMPAVDYYQESTAVPVFKVNTDDLELMKKQLSKALSVSAPMQAE